MWYYIDMNEQTEPNWKDLYRSLINRQPVNWAIRALNELMGERADSKPYELLGHVDKAERYLVEYRNELSPTPIMTEKEAEMSQMIHTYFRKYDDSSAGTIVYNLVDKSCGLRTWTKFVQLVIEFIEDKEYILTPEKFNRLGYCYDFRHIGGDANDRMLELALKAWTDDGTNDNFRQMLIYFGMTHQQ